MSDPDLPLSPEAPPRRHASRTTAIVASVMALVVACGFVVVLHEGESHKATSATKFAVIPDIVREIVAAQAKVKFHGTGGISRWVNHIPSSTLAACLGLDRRGQALHRITIPDTNARDEVAAIARWGRTGSRPRVHEGPGAQIRNA